MQTDSITSTPDTTERYKELINKQLAKLDQSDFELEAWKSSTVIILERIFGPSNEKIRQIEKINIDFSSWSLRDTSGSVKKMDICKRRGKEILSVCIDELNMFGEVNPCSSSRINNEILSKSLEEKLTVTQFRKLEKLMMEESDEILLEEKINSFLNSIKDESIKDILLRILVNSSKQVK